MSNSLNRGGPFSLRRPVVSQNSNIGNLRLGEVFSNGIKNNTNSLNPETILVSSPLECDQGLIQSSLVFTNVNNVIIDNLSGSLLDSNSSVSTITFSKNLTTGSFGTIFFLNTIQNQQITINAGVNNFTTEPRKIYGYVNNNGVIDSLVNGNNVLYFKNPNDPDASERARTSSILKWYKKNSSTIFVEAISKEDVFNDTP